jgi:hypothetical protein
VDAVYYEPGEALGVPVRALFRESRTDIVSAVAFAVGTATHALVRASELPRPRPRARLRVAGTLFEVQNSPVRDASGVWSLGLVTLP